MLIEDIYDGHFLDVGSTWFAAGAQNSYDRSDYLSSRPSLIERYMDLKKSFGFGLQLGNSRLNIAKALDGVGRGSDLFARFGRTFQARFWWLA